MTPEFYVDGRNEWRWRVWAKNGRKLGDSGEGYRTLTDCAHGLKQLLTVDADKVEKAHTAAKLLTE